MAAKGGERKTVQHSSGGDAALASQLDSPVREIDLFGRMRVGVDAEHASELARSAMPAPVQIQTPGISVDLDGDAEAGACREHHLDVNFITGATQQLSSGHVA